MAGILLIICCGVSQISLQLLKVLGFHLSRGCLVVIKQYLIYSEENSTRITGVNVQNPLAKVSKASVS
jgi:hypothetical protein